MELICRIVDQGALTTRQHADSQRLPQVISIYPLSFFGKACKLLSEEEKTSFCLLFRKQSIYGEGMGLACHLPFAHSERPSRAPSLHTKGHHHAVGTTLGEQDRPLHQVCMRESWLRTRYLPRRAKLCGGRLVDEVRAGDGHHGERNGESRLLRHDWRLDAGPRICSGACGINQEQVKERVLLT